MNNIIQYLFEVTLASSVLFLGFFLFRKFLSLRIRRFYLLGCLVLPLLFPLVSFDNDQEIITQVPSQVRQVFVEENSDLNVELAVNDPMEIRQDTGSKDTETGTIINWMQIFLSIYLFVSIALFLRFIISIYSLHRLSKNPVGKDDGIKFFLINDQNFTGGSFFNFIFINDSYLNDPAFRIILTHEQTHQRHWHSLDILLSELYSILFWINPIAWILKKEIRINAEYEADHVSAKYFGMEKYANTLLNLSITPQNIGPLLSFSAMNTRKRLKQILEDKRRRWFSSIALIPFFLLATWLISCEPEMMDFAAMDPQAAMKNVKTVTTRYISHQKDTQQKDGKVIAVAYYSPDGTVDRVEQHMTYPYDFEKPFEIPFIASPDPAGVLHVLDGFNIGHAEKNILYGNDWPKYAENMFKPSELFNRSVTSQSNNYGLPEKIIIKDEINEEMFDPRYKGSRVRTYTQNFTYEGKKITSYSSNNGRIYAEYKYDGERLVEVSSGNFYSAGKANFKYKDDILINSSFYMYGKKYNHREFFYNSDGLKTRTEIYNVYGEPEYTIHYDYEYY